ncbi:hypothetical protein KP806_01325 [Paenibacillus sp. N4]|uniref:hypothetical protein n=1 Tax=Paenibacillus vietnamensis TaxID=2590547 RepID=UPI001CD10904|nr:hypothetical protein [Paenibacillus vietnamensis]MCA0753676.1 hypothetical protein [Paenibacillus vietnamensis]
MLRIRGGLAYAGLAAGAVSGIVLGLAMKLLELASGKSVYRLLLSVEFVPWLPAAMPEPAEFALHLLVSLPLGIVYWSLLSVWWAPLGLGLWMGGAMAACTWIPLTQLSERVPALQDWRALAMWMAGHLVYGLTLALFGKYWLKKGVE